MPKRYQQEDLLSIWDAIAENYDYKNYWEGLENQANLFHLLSQIGDPKEKRIIEVGCGSGFTSAVLAQRGAHCALLDISAGTLKTAVSAFAGLGLPEPECFHENALENNVPSGSFDIVWNGGVIEHFFDDGKKVLIREMLRMTKKGGKVIILVPNAWCWQFQLVQAWQKFTKKWSYGFEDDMSPKRLREICSSLGIEGVLAYAFNPVVGWRWVPVIKKFLKISGRERIENHCKRSWMGFVSVLVIEKQGARNC